MKTKIDIDSLLSEEELELTLNGRVYIVRDVTMEDFLGAIRDVTPDEIGKDPGAGLKILHNQLASIFKVDVEELKDVGLKSATLAIVKIRDWVLQEPEVKGAAGLGRPLI